MSDQHNATATASTLSRANPNRPFVAVGAVVLNSAGEVLLVRRARPPRLGEWSLPGGVIELGETIEAAVAREVLEETGLEVRVERWLMNVDSVIKGANGKVQYHYVLLDYLARVTGGTLMAGDDAAEACFCSLDEAEKRVTWSETRSLFARVRKLTGESQ